MPKFIQWGKPILMAALACSIMMVCTSCRANQKQSTSHKQHDKAAEGRKLLTAATLGRLDDVTSALAHGADPNVHDESGITPLMYAGNAAVVKALLAHGADPNAKSPQGLTPIIMVSNHPMLDSKVTSEYIRIIKLLIARKASVNVQDNRGNTALLDAASWGNAFVVTTLIQNGANVNLRNHSNVTALKAARSRLGSGTRERQYQATVSTLQIAGAKE